MKRQLMKRQLTMMALAFAMVASGLLFVGRLALADDLAGDLADAEKLFRAGKYTAAREIYEQKLPELHGEARAQVLSNIGYCWYREHKNDKALEPLRAALAIEDLPPSLQASICVRLGTCLRLTKHSAEAIEILDQGANVEGASAEVVAQALLGAAWERQHVERDDEALEVFQRVVNVPGLHHDYVAQAHISIGKALADRGQHEAAIAEFKKIDELSPVSSTKRARARVYAMESEALLAGDTPFHIQPYVTKVGVDVGHVYWVSQGEIPAGKVTLKIGEQQKEFAAETSPLPDTICRLQKAAITGLEPGQEYEYTAHCGDEKVSGSFKTAPESGGPIDFCVIGDTQSYHLGLQHLLDALGEERTDFVLHVGDVTDRGDMWGEWKASFFDPGRPYLKHSVLWPAYGNHDGGPYYPRLFDLGQHLYYSFDYGDAHFIAIDSYGGGAGGAGRKAQYEWLKQDLEANKKPWTFAYLHVPMVATNRGLDWFGENDFLPLLEEHEIDIVFSGHHPHYRRYYPIGQKGKKPILHITTGGGGGPIGGNMPSPVLALGIDVNHYTKVHIEGNKLQLSAHAISGAVIDRFELVKDDFTSQEKLFGPAVATARAKEVVSLYQELLTDMTYDLVLALEEIPAPGGQATLVLDLAKLPRGKLMLELIPADATLTLASTEKSAWKIPSQTAKMHDGLLKFSTTAPENVSAQNSGISPTGEVTLQLTTGGQAFEPITATVRLRK